MSAMFSLPVLAGHQQLRELVNAYGGAERVCKDFRMTKPLLSGYLSGSREPPFTLLLAIYWQTSYGFSQGFSESHYTHQENWSKRRIAEERCHELEGYFKRMRAILGSQEQVISTALGEASPQRLS